ncbi:DUF427 domain-containing protein [Plantibacter sp. YIM 135249]|uniref:DUF427 domain-containing protein n=1 Tax=Plantibacter sp. YIM 135249 TaxID=3423918 RepID=UPI003D32F374
MAENQTATQAAAQSERIRILPAAGTVEIRNGERLVATTDAALELHERGHDVRYYLPRSDVDLTQLQPIDTTSHCPFKGDASDYWALADDPEGTPVAWSYPEPIALSAPIAGYVAFTDTLQLEVHA